MKLTVKNAIQIFDRLVVYALLSLLMVVIIYGIAELMIIVTKGMIHRALGTTVAGEGMELLERFTMLREVFGAFLLILIGLELMKTVVMYLDEHVVHVEVVLTVAIIAIARHSIDIDYKTANPLAMLAIGAIVLALTVGYFLFRKTISNGALHEDASSRTQAGNVK